MLLTLTGPCSMFKLLFKYSLMVTVSSDEIPSLDCSFLLLPHFGVHVKAISGEEGAACKSNQRIVLNSTKSMREYFKCSSMRLLFASNQTLNSSFLASFCTFKTSTNCEKVSEKFVKWV